MKKLSDPVRKVNSQCLGLDVHKSVTVYCVLDGDGARVAEGRVGSRRKEIESLIRSLMEGGDLNVTFEASRSSLWVYGVVSPIVGKDHTHVAKAKDIRAIANSKRKNDKNDAWWLAYLTFEGRLPTCYVPEGRILELRVATRERRAAVQRRTEIINRLKAHLAQVGEVVPGSSIRTKKAKAFLVEKAETLEGARGMAVRKCLDELEYQEAVIVEWEVVIDSLASDLPDVKLIEEQIPGHGRIIASTIVAESGDVRRFHSAAAYGSSSGLTPTDRSTSGLSIHGGISREGSPHLRWALTQAAMACLRAKGGPALAVGDWIRARQKRMGNKAKARAAGARKLAETIWRLFHYGECFDPAKPFGGKASA